MSDEMMLFIQVWAICVLGFADAVLAITQHPEWFGAVQPPF